MRFGCLNPSWALALVVFLALPAGAAENPRIEIEEIVLDNGMTWLLHENHDSPTVMAGWTALVGSVNERPGITGISHLGQTGTTGRWFGESEKSYRVEYHPDLETANGWQILARRTGDGTETSFFHAGSAGRQKGFYRIVRE